MLLFAIQMITCISDILKNPDLLSAFHTFMKGRLKDHALDCYLFINNTIAMIDHQEFFHDYIRHDSSKQINLPGKLIRAYISNPNNSINSIRRHLEAQMLYEDMHDFCKSTEYLTYKLNKLYPLLEKVLIDDQRTSLYNPFSMNMGCIMLMK